MSREFGLYPKNREPLLWVGCRGILKNKKLDIPYDRWSSEINHESGKEDFLWWIDNVAIPKIEAGVAEGRTKFWFGSESNFYACEADDRDGSGYLYIGFYSTNTYDKIIKEY